MDCMPVGSSFCTREREEVGLNSMEGRAVFKFPSPVEARCQFFVQDEDVLEGKSPRLLDGNREGFY